MEVCELQINNKTEINSVCSYLQEPFLTFFLNYRHLLCFQVVDLIDVFSKFLQKVRSRQNS